MPLTREQYNRIMRVYDERRRRSDAELEQKRQELYRKHPAIEECDRIISESAVQEAQALLRKDRRLSADIRGRREQALRRKEELLCSLGLCRDYLEPQYVCKLCRDTGYINNEKCQCFRKMESELIYLDSGLPKLLKKENFESFDLNVFDDEKSIKELLPNLVITQRAYMEEIVLPKIQSFMSSFFRSCEGNLLMTGPPGTGKTFLSNCIANEAINRCFGIIYESATEMFELFSRESFQREQDEGQSGRVREIFDCQLLIIDDLGTELTSSFINSRLFMLINHRLKNSRSTIISSNLSMNQMRDLYGERIVSRLMESYVLIPFYGDDLRLRGGMRK